jgi:hypothetical protein
LCTAFQKTDILSLKESVLGLKEPTLVLKESTFGLKEPALGLKEPSDTLREPDYTQKRTVRGSQRVERDSLRTDPVSKKTKIDVFGINAVSKRTKRHSPRTNLRQNRMCGGLRLCVKPAMTKSVVAVTEGVVCIFSSVKQPLQTVSEDKELPGL